MLLFLSPIMLKNVGEGQFFNLIQKGFILFTVTVSLSLPRPLRKLLFISLLFCFFSVSLYLGLTGPVSMGAKGELCKEHRFWHGELASCKDIITNSENFKRATGPLVDTGITTGGPEMISGISLYYSLLDIKD